MVGVPATSMFSLTVNGTPCSGPSRAPSATARSAASAAARAWSASRRTMALRRGLTASMRSRCAWTTSRLLTSRSRIMPASSTAPLRHSSLMPSPPVENEANVSHRMDHRKGGDLPAGSPGPPAATAISSTPSSRSDRFARVEASGKKCTPTPAQIHAGIHRSCPVAPSTAAPLEQAELQAHDDAVPAPDHGVGHDPQSPGRPRGQHDPRHGEQHGQAAANGQRDDQP